MAKELVASGTHVEVDLIGKKGKRERLSVDIVPDREADFDGGRIGEGTPLARAIIGKPAGTTVPYRVGDLLEAKIVAISPAQQAGAHDTAAEREEKLRQARSQAELGNMISFALTFDSKWGDYDPEEIAAHWDENRGEPVEKPDQPEEQQNGEP